MATFLIDWKEQSVNLEAQDEQHCTPLHLACKKGSQECIILLLRRGANIYALDHRKWSPLHYASYNGHPRAVNFLVKTEADEDKLPGMKNTQARTAFIIAKDDKVKKAFSRKYRLFLIVIDIWKACKEGDLDMVRVLVWAGQDVNEQTSQRANTPLHIAARHGHYLIAKYLCESKADTTLENYDRQTPAMFLQDGLNSMPQKIDKLKAAAKGKKSAELKKAQEKLKYMGDTRELLGSFAQAAAARK